MTKKKITFGILIVLSLMIGYPLSDIALASTLQAPPSTSKIAVKTPPKKEVIAKKPAAKKKTVAKKAVKKEKLTIAPALFTENNAPHSAKPVAKKKAVTKKKS